VAQQTHRHGDGRTGRKRGWFRAYVVGLGLGVLAAVYGVVALIAGKTFLPGYQVHSLLITGRPGRALALAYLAGGLYLLLRHYAEDRIRSEKLVRRAYSLQNGLLALLIACMVYALLHVGSLA